MQASKIQKGDQVANVYGTWNRVASARAFKRGIRLTFDNAVNVDWFQPGDDLTVKHDGVIDGPFADVMRNQDERHNL